MSRHSTPSLSDRLDHLAPEFLHLIVDEALRDLEAVSEGYSEDFLDPELKAGGIPRNSGYNDEGISNFLLFNSRLRKIYFARLIKTHTWRFKDPDCFKGFIENLGTRYPPELRESLTKLYLEFDWYWDQEGILTMTEILQSMAYSSSQRPFPRLQTLRVKFPDLWNPQINILHPLFADMQIWGRTRPHQDWFVNLVDALANIRVKKAEVEGLEDTGLAKSIEKSMVEGAAVQGLVRPA